MGDLTERHQWQHEAEGLQQRIAVLEQQLQQAEARVAETKSQRDSAQDAEAVAWGEVDSLREQLKQAEARVSELERVLLEVNDIAKETHKDWKRCIQLMEGPWLLRKQAEAVEDAVSRHAIKSATSPDYCYSEGLLHYSGSLRQQASDLELGGGE